MATIIQRSFNDGLDKGISLGCVSGSVDNFISRTLGVGSNWKVMRMGILCGISEYSDYSYTRASGLHMGFSSASNGFCGFGSNRTFLGASFGNFISEIRAGSSNTYHLPYYTDLTSGSFFAISEWLVTGYETGSLTAIYGEFNISPINYMISNLGNINQRRSILMVEVSASSPTSQIVKFYGMQSSSVKNRSYTLQDLVSALTSSIPATVDGTLLTAINTGPTPLGYNLIRSPLDTAFVEWSAGTPLEIYDWFIYKVK